MLRNVRTKKRNGVKFAFALVILSAAIFAMACGVSFAKNLSSSSGGDNARYVFGLHQVDGGEKHLLVGYQKRRGYGVLVS